MGRIIFIMALFIIITGSIIEWASHCMDKEFEEAARMLDYWKNFHV